jgi:hypothetical protein
MLVPRRPLAVSPALALLAAGAMAGAAAAAPTVSTTTPCVTNLGVPGAPTLPFAGRGFTPHVLVTVRAMSPADPTPRELTTVRADAAGRFSGRVEPPAFRTVRTTLQSFTLVALETTNPANTATSAFRQVRFGFAAAPSTGAPNRQVRYTARGFVPGRAVYAHFRFNGVTRRDVRLGVARSPCGIVSKRMSLLPAKTRFGRWTIFMDQSPRFSRRTLLQARGSLVIRRAT